MTVHVTGDVVIRVWLPGVDYLIGPEPYTVAHCLYCLHSTEWRSNVRVRAEIIDHLIWMHPGRAIEGVP